MTWIRTIKNEYVNSDLIFKVAIEQESGNGKWQVVAYPSHENEPRIILRRGFDNERKAEEERATILRSIGRDPTV